MNSIPARLISLMVVVLLNCASSWSFHVGSLASALHPARFYRSFFLKHPPHVLECRAIARLPVEPSTRGFVSSGIRSDLLRLWDVRSRSPILGDSPISTGMLTPGISAMVTILACFIRRWTKGSDNLGSISTLPSSSAKSHVGGSSSRNDRVSSLVTSLPSPSKLEVQSTDSPRLPAHVSPGQYLRSPHGVSFCKSKAWFAAGCDGSQIS